MTSIQDRNNPGCRYVFICGLHRSGTSVLGRNVARLENCTGFKDTGVVEDEGQFLQDVYPIDGVYGGAGRFGFHPNSHRTESSPFDLGECGAAASELACLLGQQQVYLRRKNPSEPPNDQVSTGGISQQLLYHHETPPCARKYGQPEVEDKRQPHVSFVRTPASLSSIV